MKYQFVKLLLPSFKFMLRQKRNNNLSAKDIGMTRAILSTMLERL